MKKRIIMVIALMLVFVQLFSCPIEALTTTKFSTVSKADVLVTPKTDLRIKKAVPEVYVADIEKTLPETYMAELKSFDSYKLAADEKEASIETVETLDASEVKEYLECNNVNKKVSSALLKDCRLENECSFDEEAMQFVCVTKLVSKSGIVIDTTTERFDAFRTATGEIDAEMIVDGKPIVISEFDGGSGVECSRRSIISWIIIIAILISIAGPCL